MKKLLDPDMVSRDYTEVWWIDAVGYSAETAAEKFAAEFWNDKEPEKIVEWCGNLFRLENKTSPYRVDYKVFDVKHWKVGTYQISRVHGPMTEEDYAE